MDESQKEVQEKWFLHDQDPEHWFLPDILNWIAFRILPTKILNIYKADVRESLEELGINLFDIAELVSPAFLTPTQTDYLGVGKDPKLMRAKEQQVNDERLRKADHYERAVQTLLRNDQRSASKRSESPILNSILPSNSFFESNRLKIAIHKSNFIKRATEHEIYSTTWVKELKIKLQVHKNRILYLLRSSSLVAEGILLNASESQGVNYRLEVQENFNDFLANRNSQVKPYSNIPAEAWNADSISWDASSLEIPHKVYLLVRMSKRDVLRVLPLDVSDKPIGSEKTTSIGRPQKHWNKVLAQSLKITNNGTIHIKQDALAQQLSEWYEETFRDQISLSSVKKKLKEYEDCGLLNVSKS
ncbi:hypothetical protein [Litorimonas haliclonae]|uniref:hypothetical protein n=1 Tax=Litorimonas haliclonae TaxID=2081977 RepID=UPI0039EE37A5